MKKLVILSLGLLFMWSCSNSPQSMAERGVTKHLKQSIAKYDAVSFGVLDTITVGEDPAYIATRDSMQIYMDGLKQTADQFKLAENQKNAKRLKAVLSDFEKFYNERVFKINHKYKANTTEGKNEEVDKDFYLNSMYEVVE